jgi:glycerophosphodiester phosphodiesterase
VFAAGVALEESELGPRQRSMSVGGSEYNPAELTEKIKHTRDFNG